MDNVWRLHERDGECRRSNGAGIDIESYYRLREIAPSPVTAGDYNNNGIVDAADYVAWRKGGPLLNDPIPGATADDFTVWRSHFGTSTAASGATIRICRSARTVDLAHNDTGRLPSGAVSSSRMLICSGFWSKIDQQAKFCSGHNLRPAMPPSNQLRFSFAISIAAGLAFACTASAQHRLTSIAISARFCPTNALRATVPTTENAKPACGSMMPRLRPAKLESGAVAIVPRKPEASELIRRVTSTDEDERMPPAKFGKPLSKDEIAALRKWIDQGAQLRDALVVR